MNRFVDRRFVLFLLITLALGIVSFTYIYGLRLNEPVIRSDGIGYYLYLPAVFIDHDITLRQTVTRNSLHPIPGLSGFLLHPSKKGFLNKYSMGTAILESPFFLIIYGSELILGIPPDGFSFPFQIANIVSSLFYLAMGLFFIYRLLVAFFSVNLSIFTLLALTFGTNFFHYATYDGSLSHVYSIALLSGYLYIVLSYREFPSARLAFLAGFVLGLIVLTRNLNVVFGAAFFLAEIELILKSRLWKSFFHFSIFLAVCVLVFLPQLFYWHCLTGNFLVNSYQYESDPGDVFTFSRPHLWDYLFGIRKGAFLWSPLLGLSLLGFFCLSRELVFWGLAAAPFIALQVYIYSCWGDWGGGFSCRFLVDTIPLLALPLASLFTWFYRRFPARLITGGVIVLILEELFLMHSYWIGVIPFDGATWRTIQKLPAGYVVYWNWLGDNHTLVLAFLIFTAFAALLTGGIFAFDKKARTKLVVRWEGGPRGEA